MYCYECFYFKHRLVYSTNTDNLKIPVAKQLVALMSHQLQYTAKRRLLNLLKSETTEKVTTKKKF